MAGGVLLGFFGLAYSIRWEVIHAIENAQACFPGDEITALESLAKSESRSLHDRNGAIWALGQLAAPRALPVLRSLQTGTSCDHEHAVCQHEVAKAIRGCTGAFNASALVWRHGALARCGS
ncbi:MAG: hypothetical protein R3E12_08665 [Candidatus Eisenbacteria bacterium]